MTGIPKLFAEYTGNKLSLTTPVRQSIPLQLNLLAADRSFKQSITNDQYAGNFRVAGVTTKKIGGSTPTPKQAAVVLLDERAGIAARRAFSDPQTGAYSFDNIRGDIRYTVLAFDPDEQVNMTIADNIQAEPMP